jgi:hypothetical protein
VVELDAAATLKRKRDEATNLPIVAPPTTLLPPAGDVSITPAPGAATTGLPTPTNEDELQALFKSKIDQMSTHEVIGHEYHVVPGQSHHGVGDFLLKKVGEKRLVVVEVKYIDLARTGPTASTRRTKHRKKVKEQAWRYACHARAKYPGYAITYGTFTNEFGWQKLGELQPVAPSC